MTLLSLLPLASSGGEFNFVEVLHHHLLNESYGDYGISKHLIMMWMASALLIVVAVTAAAKGEGSLYPKGWFRNLFEIFLLFVRDEVVRPWLGKDGDKHLPVLWTFFFFILFNNLLGLLPDLSELAGRSDNLGFLAFYPQISTATGNICVTASLAVMAMIYYHSCGIWEQGFFTYIKNIVPSGVPLLLWPALFVIEVAGHLAKPFALCVRLAANMNGGHIVLLAFFGMLYMISVWAFPVIIPFAVAIYFLEIFVALVQAYVFTFLVTVFLSGAVHPH